MFLVNNGTVCTLLSLMNLMHSEEVLLKNGKLQFGFAILLVEFLHNYHSAVQTTWELVQAKSCQNTWNHVFFTYFIIKFFIVSI